MVTTAHSAGPQPVKATIRAYQVGFGDCFLLRFDYSDNSARHILIDFGSTGMPKNDPKADMKRVADDIAQQCGGKLDIVVATHRHADHISGFATSDNGDGPGDVIRALKPDRVLQPWTEAPEAPENWAGPADAAAAKKAFDTRIASLESMHAIAESVVRRLDSEKGFNAQWPFADRLRFLGEDNIKNLSAVKNLMTMAGDETRNVYLFHGCDVDLDEILPNIKVHVLGPPTLQQSQSIKKYAKTSSDYWLRASPLVALGADAAVARQSDSKLFPQLSKEEMFRKSRLPSEMRWVAERVDNAEADQLLGIVTALDDAVNNTSLILLFEAGTRKLLFPGDAQLENWNYALQSGMAELLDDVDFYKVGHHGSLNATPKAMWNRFNKRNEEQTPDRLKTVMSTMAGKHGGKKGAPTEVPRMPLVDELKAQSELHNTQDLEPGDLCEIIVIDLT
ncbi:hypothetical protein [Pseudomonas synxantha]|uniref:Uncharacterized protein n=1 Tax=Pseudomonas synxantha TaxID=47883 RepID=A0ACC6JKF0_9PSED|nr:hypothetical protein [Pseudomonas synxantha]MDR6606687.1 hypothetical protein [Pseudomonas synxantha]